MTTAITNTTIWDEACQQEVFRRLLQAMAHPGQCEDLRIPAALEIDALTTVVATLVDQATSLADPHHLLDERSRRFCGAATADVERATFVLLDGSRWSDDLRPGRGSLERPDRGATCIVRVATIGAGEALAELTGPGIERRVELRCTGLDPRWLAARNDWCADFPTGVDCLFVDATQCLALPRSTSCHGGLL